MKRWYLYLITVPLGLVILAYLIVKLNSPSNLSEIRNRDNQGKNTQSDVRKMPDVQAVPKAILELRQEHQLRPLTELEAGTKIQGLPKGIYGFSTCSELLDTKRGNKFSLEIH
ncbi:MAG: hypothetical protein KJS98_21135, partial [Nitrospirae bacterium]|nr:hypothetical protein [Nitrospirota bacterium]